MDDTLKTQTDLILKTLVSIVGTTCIIGLLAGCGSRPGFVPLDNVCAECPDSSDASDSSKEGADRTSQNLPSTPVEDVYAKVNLKAQIQGGSYDQLLAVDFDVPTESLILNIPLAMNPFIAETSGQISQLKGVTYSTSSSKEGNKYLSIRVPIKYVMKGVSKLNPARLPNGDPLPRIPAGELPGLALKLFKDQEVSLHLYIGVEVVAVYIQTPFNPYLGLTYPIKNQAGSKVVGYFVTIPEKEAYQGGFFLSHTLPQDVARYLDEHVNWN